MEGSQTEYSLRATSLSDLPLMPQNFLKKSMVIAADLQSTLVPGQGE